MILPWLGAVKFHRFPLGLTYYECSSLEAKDVGIIVTAKDVGIIVTAKYKNSNCIPEHWRNEH